MLSNDTLAWYYRYSINTSGWHLIDTPSTPRSTVGGESINFLSIWSWVNTQPTINRLLIKCWQSVHPYVDGYGSTGCQIIDSNSTVGTFNTHDPSTWYLDLSRTIFSRVFVAFIEYWVYENHQIMDWTQAFHSDHSRILLLLCQHSYVLLWADCKRSSSSRLEWEKKPLNVLKLVVFIYLLLFLSPNLSLNLVWTIQLTTTQRNVGGSARESGSGRCKNKLSSFHGSVISLVQGPS